VILRITSVIARPIRTLACGGASLLTQGLFKQATSLPELVEPVEKRPCRGEQCLVVCDQRDTAHDRVEAGGLGCVVEFVLEIALVDDPSDPHERGVAELVAVEERLEGAPPAMLREIDAAHVERCCIGRDVIGIVDEHEARVGVCA
jgi:hypothetical protein